jgi:hypothetical protein
VPDLKDCIVINRRLVETLARQIGLPIDQERTTESQLGFTGKIGIGFKASRRRQPLPTNDPRLLEPIVANLRESGRLHIYPPQLAEEFWETRNEWYVYEETVATPVLIPLDQALPESRHLPPAVTVWIVGERLKGRSKNEVDNVSSLVFIVQELTNFDTDDVTWRATSPLSAFQQVIQVAAVLGQKPGLGHQARERGIYHDESWHEENPAEKLELLGGVRQRTRKIETVYKVAYMNSTRSYRRRYEPGDDVLAYPLYIVEV